jgi:hypothetical protein
VGHSGLLDYACGHYGREALDEIETALEVLGNPLGDRWVVFKDRGEGRLKEAPSNKWVLLLKYREYKPVGFH